jgi:hypothetical protein
MNRYLVFAATAVLAVTSVSFQPQTAEAGFLRRVLFRGGHHHSGPFGHHHHRRVFIAPIVAAPVLAAPGMRAPAVSQGAPSAPRNADGSGRVFDPASMAGPTAATSAGRASSPGVSAAAHGSTATTAGILPTVRG